MGDVISWGLINSVKKAVKKVQSTVEGLDVETPLENSLNEMQSALNTAITQIGEQVDGMEETVNNAPVGGPLPFPLMNFSAQSTESGIKLTYEPTIMPSGGEKPSVYGSIQPYGVMIRYDTNGYPQSPIEGILAIDDTDIVDKSDDAFSLDNGWYLGKTKSFTVVGLTSNIKYYFSAFPYSYSKQYNTNVGTDASTNNRKHRATCTWTGTKGTLTVNVTQDYDYKPLGEYTVTMTPTAGGQAITKTQSGAATVVFSGLEAGEYTLSFSDVVYFIKPSNQSVSIIAGQSQIINSTYIYTDDISKMSWSQINQISQLGIASEIFSIGDTKDISVNGETLTVEIIGFNHDNLSNETGKAGITFATKNLMTERQQMRSTNSNDGGYSSSFLYSYLNTTVYNYMDDDLKSVIKSVVKYTNTGYTDPVMGNSLKVWALAEIEIGLSGHSIPGEGTQYPRYTTNASRSKRLSNGDGLQATWWTRSPYSDNSNDYVSVSLDGSTGVDSSPRGSNGVCFAFCV